jgi:predicted lipid-binding transport protein (Tim44 family)
VGLTWNRWRWAARPTPEKESPAPSSNLDAGADEVPQGCTEHPYCNTVEQPDNSTRRRVIGWASALLGGLIAGLFEGSLGQAVQAIIERVGAMF